MKRTAVFLAMVILHLCVHIDSSNANDFYFRLSSNKKALDSEFEAEIDISSSRLISGIGGFYDKDDFRLLFVKALIGNELFVDGLTAGLGFKGSWGEAETHKINEDILNLGFACYAGYDLSKSGLNNVPVILASSFYMSPEPLAFGDTEELIEIIAEGTWKILDHAGLVISYRYIEIDFDRRPKKQKSDNAGYFGLKFFF